ncbi:MAG TPA: SIS domain-containing protein [Phycisphaerales bacterium]|nr:SIS domain-containing protein [Phycisphaerales bacterium]
MDNAFRAIAGELDDARIALERFATPAAAANLERIADAITDRLREGGKVLACGNGGSAADAMHFCEELTGRYRDDRPAIAAVACVDPGHITCTANDFGYEFVFSRWVEALGRENDALVVLSTSGNSRNVLRAVETARTRSMLTVSLLGKGGGVLRGLCHHEVIAPGETADRIQELHMLALHTLVGAIERRLTC